MFGRCERSARPNCCHRLSARTYAGAGHIPHVTHPEEYVAELVAFIQSKEVSTAMTSPPVRSPSGSRSARRTVST